MVAVKFDEECSPCLDQRKRDKMQYLHDPNQSNVGNQNNIRREASKHFMNKQKGYLIDELEINSKFKNIRDLCRNIIDLRRVTNLKII